MPDAQFNLFQQMEHTTNNYYLEALTILTEKEVRQAIITANKPK